MSSLDASKWLADYGDTLYRYAFARVRSETIAEDLVQETLLAGLQNLERFNQQAAVSTWLVAILKNKLLDHWRKVGHEHTFSIDSLWDEDLMRYQFDQNGHWQVELIDWGTPESNFDQHEFWEIFTQCQSRLPKHMAELLSLRMDGVSTEECCEILALKNANQLWVTLSRARMKLRQCLDTHWFTQAT